jgi:uncharacterized protein (TIGR04255 family)
MPHYKNAPIREAVIDIKVELPSEVDDLEKLRGIKNQVINDYPREETRHLGEGLLQFGAAIRATAQQKPWSLVFWNVANNQAVQARMDGFSFSRLEPYEDFDRLRNEARRLWDIYRVVTRPTKITRLAVRYINQLNLPGTKVEPEDYLNVYPYLSNKLPDELRSMGPFLMNLHLQQPDLRGVLVLNQALTAPKKPDTISVVLDFDLHVDTPPVASEQELWEFFEKLRQRKNEYFEACITDKTRELIS